MKKSTSTTMADIARHVGVSRTAVSFVLNGQSREKGISVQMEKQILQAAKALNYRPSLIARSLVTNRSMTIGLILPNMGVTYGPPLAETIEMEALDHGYQVLLCHHGGDEKRFADILQVMTGRHVDGLIVVPTIDFKESPLLEELLNANVPAVFVERDPQDSRANFVTTDVPATVKMAVDYLVELGHDSIVFINASPDLTASQQRQNSFNKILDQPNSPLKNGVVMSGWNSEEEAITALQEIRQGATRFTAAVVVSAERALNVFVAAQKIGLSIPGELSLITISGVKFTDFHRVRITEVTLPYQAVGRSALQILLQSLQSSSQSEPRREFTAPILTPGETTGPAAQ